MKLPSVLIAPVLRLNFFGIALLAFSSSALVAGVVTPVVPEGDWMEGASWGWKPTHEAAELEARVPESDDLVLISRKEGSIITLSVQAPAAGSLFVGHPALVETPQHLILKDRAELEIRFLAIGRAGGSNPASEGIVELFDNAVLAVSNETRLAEKGSAKANNGYLFVNGGEFSTRVLLAGMGGTSDGSILRIVGSKPSVLVQRRAVLHGKNDIEDAAGVTLEMIADSQGVAPLSIAGDLELVDEPQLRVDLSQLDTASLPKRLLLVHVEGSREGEFATPEWANLPAGLQVEGAWADEGRSFWLTVGR